MDDNIFKLSLRLEQLSAIAAAINIWERQAVREEIRNFLICYKTRGEVHNNWDKAVNCALRQIKFSLPEKLLYNIENLVKILGLKLYCWLQHAVFDLNFTEYLNFICTEKIYWTCFGTVDGKRIVKSWLQNEEILQNIKHECFFKKPMFCIAVMYAEEDFLRDHLEEMKGEIIKHTEPSTEWSDFEIRAFWFLLCKHRAKNFALSLFQSYRKSKTLAFNLFNLSVRSRSVFAAQYFFNYINDDKKQESISFNIQECLSKCKLTESFSKSNSGAEVLIFLIKNMDDINKLEFISENFLSLFSVFLHKWPWQEFCFNFLLNDVSYLPAIHSEVLNNTVMKLGTVKTSMRYFITAIRHYPCYTLIFKILLEKVPAEAKKRIFKDKIKYLHSLTFLNFDTLALIINDPDLQDCQNEMLSILEKHLRELILKDGSYRDVDRIMEVCSIKDKQKYNLLRTFLLSGRLEEATNHLDWLSNTEDEKTILKKQIDVQTILNFFIREEKYDLAQEYLKWQCDNEEEIKNTKNMIFSHSVLRDHVFELWCAHTNGSLNFSTSDVRHKCDKLLRWFFESDTDVIEFRKTKLTENMDEFMIIRKYWNSLFRHNSFSGFGDFLEFCFWSHDEVDGLKEKVRNNAEWWIDTYVAKEGYFLMVDSLFKWVFQNNTERREKIISDYMEGPNGALLLLKSLRERNSKTFSDLLNNWIGPHPSVFIYGIKVHLDALKSNSGCKHAIFGIKSLLDELNKGNTITDSVLSDLLYSKLRECNCENKFYM